MPISFIFNEIDGWAISNQTTTTSKPEERNMINVEEGKYYKTQYGWVVGPIIMKKNYWGRGKYPHIAGGQNWSLDGLGNDSSIGNLVEEVAEPRLETVRMEDLKLGSAVYLPRRGVIGYVQLIQSEKVCIKFLDDSQWYYGWEFEVMKSAPDYDLSVVAPDLREKWVFFDEQFLQVNYTFLRFTYRGFQEVSVDGRVNGHGLSLPFSLPEEYEVLDENPLKDVLKIFVGGEGQYLVAYPMDLTQRQYDFSKPLLAYESDEYHYEGRQYYTFKDGYLDRYSLNESTAMQYCFVRTDDISALDLPFSYDNCVQSLKNYWERSSELVEYHHLPKEMKALAILSRARLATDTRGNIALYKTDQQMESGRIQSMRPGKAFRHLFPQIKDADLEKLVDQFRKDFPTGDYTIHRGRERADFKKAYSSNIAPMQNPRTASDRKSLANSCMRKDYSFLKGHPAEAYASGDFEVIWSEDSSGRIGSRVVVYLNEGGAPQAGPVYGTCEYSIDLLHEELKKMGAENYHNSSWVGAKMLKIRTSSYEYLMPYSDHEQCLEDYDDQYFVIEGGDSDDATYAANTTGGTVSARDLRTECSCCGDNYDDDDMTLTNDGDVCEHCLGNHYFRCECYHEWYHNDYHNEVYHIEGTRAVSHSVCDDARLHHYIECQDGEYYPEYDVIELHNGDYVPCNVETFVCQGNGGTYVLEDGYPLLDNDGGVTGEFLSKDYYEDNTDKYSLDESGFGQAVKEAA